MPFNSIPNSAMKTLLCLAVSSVLGLTAAASDSYYDSAGRNRGRSQTDQNGNTRYYDSAGRYQGRAQQGSNGSTNYYDSAGRHAGRA